MTAFDAKCAYCGHVHIVQLDADESEGDVVKYPHVTGRYACGEYARHKVVARLDGVEREKDAADGEAAG